MDRRRSNAIEQVDLTRDARHKARDHGLRLDLYTSSSKDHSSKSKTSERDAKTMKFASIVEHLSSNFMSDSLSKILAFLKAGNVELSFPNIDKCQEEFLVRISSDRENLYCDKFNKPCKGICRDILRVLDSNRRVFKWVHLYESGMISKRVLLYQKEYLNKKHDSKEPKPKISSHRSNNSRHFTSDVESYDPREIFLNRLKAISSSSEESSTNLDSATKKKKSSTNSNLDSARKEDKKYKEGRRSNVSEQTPRSMTNYPKTTIQWQPANPTDPTEPSTTPPNTPPRTKRAVTGRHSKLARALAVPIEGGKARRMMQLMGWVGGGLGARGEGITEPIMPALDIVVGRGLGHSLTRGTPRQDRERDRQPRHRDAVRKESRDRKHTSSRKTSTVDFRVVLLKAILKLLKEESSVTEVKMGEAVCAKEKRFLRMAMQSFNARKNVGLNTEEEIDLVRKILEKMNSKSSIHLDVSFSDDLRTITIMKKSGSQETSKRKRRRMAAELDKAKDDYNHDRLSETRTDNCQNTSFESKSSTDTDSKIPQTLLCQANVDLLAQDLKTTGRKMTAKALQSLAYRIILLKKVLNFVKSDHNQEYVVFDHFFTTRMCKFAETIIDTVNSGTKGGLSTRTENTLMREIFDNNDCTLKIILSATRRKFALIKKDKIVSSTGVTRNDSENNRNNNNVEEEQISSRTERLRKICDDVVTISDDDGSLDSDDDGDDSSVDSICQAYNDKKCDSIEKDDENDSEGSIYDLNDESDDVKSVSNDISDFKLIPKELMISMDDASEVGSSSDTNDVDNSERKEIEDGMECLEINLKEELIEERIDDDSRIHAIDKEIRDKRLTEKCTVESIEDIVLSSEDNCDDILEIIHEEDTIESVLQIGESDDTDKHSLNGVHEVHRKEKNNVIRLDTAGKGDSIRILEMDREKSMTLPNGTENKKVDHTNILEVKTTMNDILITDVKSVSNENFMNVNDSESQVFSVAVTSDDNDTLISNDVTIISNDTSTIIEKNQLLSDYNDTNHSVRDREILKLTLSSVEPLIQNNTIENQDTNDGANDVADENAIKLNGKRSTEEFSNDIITTTVLEVSNQNNEVINFGQHKLEINENNQVTNKATDKMETNEYIITEVIVSSPGKRSRSDSECSEAQIAKKPKMQLDFVINKILGIVPDSYPTNVINKLLAAKIQREMLTEMNRSEFNKPHLECHGINNGVLKYKCCDEKSSKWLENFIQKVCIPDEKIKILATDTALEETKSKIKMAARTCSFLDENASDVLKRIELYNNKIRTNNWDVLEEIIREDYILLTVQVDKDSYRLISESSFCLYAGIDMVEFSKILT